MKSDYTTRSPASPATKSEKRLLNIFSFPATKSVKGFIHIFSAARAKQ